LADNITVVAFTKPGRLEFPLAVGGVFLLFQVFSDFQIELRAWHIPVSCLVLFSLQSGSDLQETVHLLLAGGSSLSWFCLFATTVIPSVCLSSPRSGTGGDALSLDWEGSWLLLFSSTRS